MGIRYYEDDLRLVHVQFGCGDVLLRACQGRQSGAVALLMHEGPPGEIGRKTALEEVVDITAHDTVLLSFSDPRSIDVVMEALKTMKGYLTGSDTGLSLQDDEAKVWLAAISEGDPES